MADRIDLTGFAALLGESFASRIDLLAKVLRDAHFPSLGTYKERLLAETIRRYLPGSVEVGTGFVLFPCEDTSPPGGEKNDERHNKSAFTLSRQCDILIFDSTSFPPVFRDGDFVVLRPEAVKAVIEVKGALSLKEAKHLIDSFVDFGHKWKTTQLFYKSRSQALTSYPYLLGMAWDLARRKDGRPQTNPRKVREFIAAEYAKRLSIDELVGFPLLSQLLIYNEAEITSHFGSDDGSVTPWNFGWTSTDGRFRRFAANGSTYRDKDRTIAALLSRLHIATQWSHYNRFFSFTDEIRTDALHPYSHYGTSWAWRDVMSVKNGMFNAGTVQ